MSQRNACLMGFNIYFSCIRLRLSKVVFYLQCFLIFIWTSWACIRLNGPGIGGDIGGHLTTHLCYTDDLCLIHLSSVGMQSLLDICNSSKSYALYFKPKHINVDRPCFYLNLLEMPRVDQFKYLGIMICTNNCNIDLKRQMKILCKH